MLVLHFELIPLVDLEIILGFLCDASGCLLTCLISFNSCTYFLFSNASTFIFPNIEREDIILLVVYVLHLPNFPEGLLALCKPERFIS